MRREKRDKIFKWLGWGMAIHGAIILYSFGDKNPLDKIHYVIGLLTIPAGAIFIALGHGMDENSEFTVWVVLAIIILGWIKCCSML